MKKIFIFICFFLIILGKGLAQEKKVIVESPYEYSLSDDGKRVLNRKTYLNVRPFWGKRITFLTSEIKPTAPLLKKEGTPIEISVSLDRNFKKMSVGLEGGYLSTKWNNEISIKGFFLNVVGRLDGLFKTPYAVPYVKAGLISLDAEIGDAVIETNSVVLQYSFGLMTSLNWIDRALALDAYSNYGLLNTYLYFGMKKISETNSDPELDLSTALYPEFGLQIEF